MKRYPYHPYRKVYASVSEVTQRGAYIMMHIDDRQYEAFVEPRHLAPDARDHLSEGLILVLRNRRDDHQWHSLPNALTKRKLKKARIEGRRMAKLFEVWPRG